MNQVGWTLLDEPTLSRYLSVNVCPIWGGGDLLVNGGWRWIRYCTGWQPEQRELLGPEDNMAASISIFSSNVESLTADIAALLVSRRNVRGMSQKTCCGPRWMLFPAFEISSMLDMEGLSGANEEKRGQTHLFRCHWFVLSNKLLLQVCVKLENPCACVRIF